jgi:hypothetical protein
MQPGVGYRFISSSQGVTLDIGDPWPDSTQASTHPFKIINVSINAGGNVIYQVQSGTLNNLVPIIDDYITTTEVQLDRTTAGIADPPTAELVAGNYDATTKTSYITLRAGPETTAPYQYPDPLITSNQYPVIIGGNVAPVSPDTDVWGFLVIGTITVDSISAPTTFTVSQNVTGSLWADRIKLAGITARYYYARI